MQMAPDKDHSATVPTPATFNATATTTAAATTAACSPDDDGAGQKAGDCHGAENVGHVSGRERALDAMKGGLACVRAGEGCVGWLEPFSRKRWLLLWERLQLRSIESEVEIT